MESPVQLACNLAIEKSCPSMTGPVNSLDLTGLGYFKLLTYSIHPFLA